MKDLLFLRSNIDGRGEQTQIHDSNGFCKHANNAKAVFERRRG